MLAAASLADFSNFVALPFGGGLGQSPEARQIRATLDELLQAASRSTWLRGPRHDAIAGLNELVAECGVRMHVNDGEGAIRLAAVDLVERVIDALPEGVPMPEFAAEPDGAVTLDWIASRSRMFSISVDGSDRLAYAWLDGSAHGHGVETFHDGRFPPRLVEEINRIVKNVRPAVGAFQRG